MPQTSYASADLNYGNSSSRTTLEMSDLNARPAISGSVETMGQYNIVFIGSRHFDTAEVKLLIDAVPSSRFITAKKSRALIRKLWVFVEPQQRQPLMHPLCIDHRSKAASESVILIVDHLYTAIIGRKKVTFQHFDYTPEKRKSTGMVGSSTPHPPMLCLGTTTHIHGGLL